MNKLTHTNVLWSLHGHQLMGRQAKWSCPGRCLVFTASPIPWSPIPSSFPSFPGLNLSILQTNSRMVKLCRNSLQGRTKAAQAVVFPPHVCPHPPQAPSPTYTPGIFIVFGNSAAPETMLVLLVVKENQ